MLLPKSITSLWKYPCLCGHRCRLGVNIRLVDHMPQCYIVDWWSIVSALDPIIYHEVKVDKEQQFALPAFERFSVKGFGLIVYID